MSARKSSPLNVTMVLLDVSSQLAVLPLMPLWHTVYVPPDAMVAPLAKVKPPSNAGPEPHPFVQVAIE